VTIWMLGLSVLILLFGGIAIDLWRALDLQRELAAVADSAAVAAASGVDEEHYRSTGEVLLDPARASTFGRSSLSNQDVDLTLGTVETASDGSEVVVRVGAELALGLLGLFVDQSEPLLITTSASAEPLIVP
jgi:uncharacterized membrane protein